MKTLLYLLFIQLLTQAVIAQPFASWTTSSLTFSNGAISRVAALPEAGIGFASASITLPEGTSFLAPGSTEFTFEANGTVYYYQLYNGELFEIVKKYSL